MEDDFLNNDAELSNTPVTSHHRNITGDELSNTPVTSHHRNITGDELSNTPVTSHHRNMTPVTSHGTITLVEASTSYNLSNFQNSIVPVIILLISIMVFMGMYEDELAYKYQANYLKYQPNSESYTFVIISDQDEKSINPSGNQWTAILKYGNLKRNGKQYSVSWEKEEIFKSNLNAGLRGMELSELTFYDGKLLTCDDRTGIIYELMMDSKKVVPRYILSVGDGKTDRALKCEWMTVVDDLLYVGSVGKEFVSDEGEIIDNDAQWVKIIDRNGKITHQNWRSHYEALREISHTQYPAYLMHEAIMWYPEHQQWVIIPRRLSFDPYSPLEDSLKGNNSIFIASRDFSSISMGRIGVKDKKKGTSGFKFIPFQNGDIIQLKSIEYMDQIETYISVVNIFSKEVLMEDQFIGFVKFEGIEFI